jgi:uncharacterized integral membrane protein (TIGR00698 family)
VANFQPTINLGSPLLAKAREIAPGLLLSAIVAVLASIIAPYANFIVHAPAMVIALAFGICLHSIAARAVFQPGIDFAVKRLLRWAVALLGLRIALSEILALGVSTTAIVVAAMIATLAAGLILARAVGLKSEYGALAGAGTAVCGASATLATASVLPPYPAKGADVAFVVVAVNVLSTIAMVVYPAICIWFKLSPQETGVMLGATIHDVAQVVGAGYSVSEPVGNTAVIVKLFRVFLLLPVVLSVGWWFATSRRQAEAANVPTPLFAFVFLALCFINSAMAALPAFGSIYSPLKTALGQVSSWGLLIAIAALGLKTSLASIRALGWRHMVVVTGTTMVIFVIVTGLTLL